MKITNFETDREKSPIMTALHELGLAHGVELVAVAIPMAGGPAHTYLIDHKDDTTPQDVALKFTAAGVLLIQAAGAAREYAAEQEAAGECAGPADCGWHSGGSCAACRRREAKGTAVKQEVVEHTCTGPDDCWLWTERDGCAGCGRQNEPQR